MLTKLNIVQSILMNGLLNRNVELKFQLSKLGNEEDCTVHCSCSDISIYIKTIK